MPESGNEAFEALDPFFEVVMEGLRELVDGTHYFDTFAEDATFGVTFCPALALGHIMGWSAAGTV